MSFYLVSVLRTQSYFGHPRSDHFRHTALDDAQTPNSEEQAVWEPPGELLNQYEVEGRTFGIWSTSLTDPAARELIQNIEILVLFFIEGASLLDLSDSDAVLERWRVFFV